MKINFNILQTLKIILEQDELISKSVAGVFISNFPEKLQKAAIFLEILNFKRNITNSCIAEVKLSLTNDVFLKNLHSVVQAIEEKLFYTQYHRIINGKETGYFFVKDFNKKNINNSVLFSFTLSIKLQPNS